MNRIIPKIFAATLICLVLSAGSSSAQFLERFEVRDLVIAPGAGVGNDSSLVIFQLSDVAMNVSVIVFETDSITPVDTLRAPGPETSTNTFFIGWHGTQSGGGSVPEGRYVITIVATDTAGLDTTVSRPVFIDVTPPTIEIQSISPSPYAPAVPGQSDVLVVRFNVTNVSPPDAERNADEIQVTLLSTTSMEIVPDSLSFVPALAETQPLRIEVDGLYELKWNASGQTNDIDDGDHNISITIIDDAGFSAVASQFFDIDKENPRIDITSPPSNRSWTVVPDSIFGFTMDRNGIDSLRVKYSAAGPLLDVTPTSIVGDTVFFAVGIADSFTVEGDYTVTMRATDIVGRSRDRAFEFTFDLTPPAGPVLDPYVGGEWHQNNYVVTGTYPSDDANGVVRFFHDGVQVDSIFVGLLDGRFSQLIPLKPGVNLLSATFVDEAGNESAVSNIVSVDYDALAGVFIPAPFLADNAFTVTSSEPATQVVIRIFDLRGDLVVELEQNSAPTRGWVVVWHGRNEGDIPVRKGPLVAVVHIRFESGTSRTTRELFLFEPTP